MLDNKKNTRALAPLAGATGLKQGISVCWHGHFEVRYDWFSALGNWARAFWGDEGLQVIPQAEAPGSGLGSRLWRRSIEPRREY